AGGERMGIGGVSHDGSARAGGVCEEVNGYDADIRELFGGAVAGLNPPTVALNYSTDDVTADGLTYGHWLLLNELLRDTPYVGRLTSAAPLVARLRGLKSPTEVEHIRRAAAITEEIVHLLTPQIRPDLSEQQLAAFLPD